MFCFLTTLQPIDSYALSSPLASLLTLHPLPHITYNTTVGFALSLLALVLLHTAP